MKSNYKQLTLWEIPKPTEKPNTDRTNLVPWKWDQKHLYGKWTIQ